MVGKSSKPCEGAVYRREPGTLLCQFLVLPELPLIDDGPDG